MVTSFEPVPKRKEKQERSTIDEAQDIDDGNVLTFTVNDKDTISI